jgi:hypothetical protein
VDQIGIGDWGLLSPWPRVGKIRIISTLYSLGAAVIHDEGRIFAATGTTSALPGRAGTAAAVASGKASWCGVRAAARDQAEIGNTDG